MLLLAIPIGTAALLGISQYNNGSFETTNNAGILSSVFSRFSSTSLVEKKEAPATPPDTQFQYDATPSAFDPSAYASEGGNSDSDLSEVSEPTALPVTDRGQAVKGKSDANPAVQDEESTSVEPSNNQYVIIIGAFRAKRNAEKCIRELKKTGTQATIFDRSPSGLYRVSIGSFSQREEANQLLSSAKSGEFSEAWLLEK